MRFYAVARNEHGRPYIEAEVTEPFMIEDYSDVIPRDEALANPDLARALEAWSKSDDHLKAADKASDVLRTKAREVFEGIEDIREAAQIVGDVDDYHCEAIRRLAPMLTDALPVLSEVLDELERDKQDPSKLAAV